MVTDFIVDGSNKGRRFANRYPINYQLSHYQLSAGEVIRLPDCKSGVRKQSRK